MNDEGHLLNDPDRVGRLIANHLFLCYSFVISCLSRTNQTWFESTEVRLVKMNLICHKFKHRDLTKS